MDTLSNSMIELLREEMQSYKGLRDDCTLDVVDLANAPHREMMAFLGKHNLQSPALDPDQQLAIISRRNPSEIKLLIDNEGLYEKVGLELIATCGRKEITEFAKLQYCYNSTIKALVQRGYYHEVELAIEKMAEDLEEETILLLIAQRCENALITILNGFDENDTENFPLSERASTELILSQMNNAIFAYIRKSGFPYGAEQIFIEFGCDELVKEYVSRYKLFDESGVKLIERGNHDLIETYLLCYDFGEKAEISFFSQGWKQLETEYVWVHNLSEKAENLLIDQRKEDILIEYLIHGDLSLSATCNLIKSNLLKVLTNLWDYGGLPEAMQVFLLKNGSIEAIRLYIDRYSLYEEAELELISQVELKGGEYRKLLNQYLIKFEYYLYERSEAAWVVLGDKSDVEIYINKQRLSGQSEQNLISRGDGDLIKQYLQKYCPCEDAVEMLLQRRIKDEIKILLDNYYPQIEFN